MRFGRCVMPICHLSAAVSVGTGVAGHKSEYYLAHYFMPDLMGEIVKVSKREYEIKIV